MWACWLLVDVDCSNTFTEGFLLRNGLHEFLILPFSKLSHVRIIHFLFANACKKSSLQTDS